MNRFYVTVALILFFSISFAAPINKSVKTGYWNQATTWSLNRVPQAGDTIFITAGNTVTIDADEILSAPSFLKIYGKLYFESQNSTLSLVDNSFAWIFSGGMIQGNSSSQKLRINSTAVFSGGQDPVYGPMMASSTSGGFAAMVNSAPVVLPVKFGGFTVSLKNNNALIQWSRAEEKAAIGFDVERGPTVTTGRSSLLLQQMETFPPPVCILTRILVLVPRQPTTASKKLMPMDLLCIQLSP